MVDTSCSVQPNIPARGDKALDVYIVASRLNVCEETVRRLCRNGELRAGRVGGRWRILESDLRKYCESIWQ